MEGTPAIYKGRIVSKDNFRVFIYAPNGTKRLVESWDEFEANMQSGVWFATAEDAMASVVTEEKPKAKPRPSRAKKVEEVVEVAPEDELEEAAPKNAAFEVTDDFLPKG